MNLEFDCTNVKNGKSAYNGYLCSLYIYSKTSVKWPLSKRPNIGFHDQLSLNAGQKYCRMLQGGGGILQYVQPSLSYHLSLRSVFCLFLAYRFTQVLLYGTFIVEKTKIIVGKVTFNAIYQRHRKSMAPY